MSREDLVILHGWSFSRERWQPLIEELKGHGYRVFYPVIPGFGHDPLGKPLTLADYTQWLSHWLRQKGIKHYTLIAHSNGGRVASALAAKRPRALKKLVLISSAGMKSKLSLKKLSFWSLAKSGKLLFSMPLLIHFGSIARKILYLLAREKDYYSAPPALAKTMANLLAVDILPYLKRISVPTLLIWGGKDQTTPLSDGLLFRDSLTLANLSLFPEASHALPYQEPKGVVQEILHFLEGEPC